MSLIRVLEPSGKEAVTVTLAAEACSVGAAGSTLKLMEVGESSPSAKVKEASDTVNPLADPDTVRLSEPSPAIASSVSAKTILPVPLLCPAGMVTVKSSTAA